MNLGENIYGYRVQKNMSQMDLANALEVSRQSVSKWENNMAQPELDKLCRMSELFDVTLDELVYGQRTQPINTTPNAMTMTLRQLFPLRVVTGAVMVLFGLVFLLLSVFWGDRLRMGEIMGDFLSVNIVLMGLAFMETYNTKVLACCGIVYFLWSIACNGIFHVQSLTNYLFMVLAGIVLLVWFIKWGMHNEKDLQTV